ncbi:MAG: glycosyltransferase family 4 protein [Armatimonadetes bacterium]|nr:glycosyltransferase family 4 protein [Armatimonadota bacterium]
MPVRISVVAHTLRHLSGDAGGMELHGANLAIKSYLKAFLSDERTEALEVFLEPVDYMDKAALAEAAQAALPEWRRGQGALRFYPSHHLPDVFADGTERIMWCIDPAYMARERAVRDRFATAPTPLVVDTHGLGHHSLWRELAPLARAEPVPFDTLLCLSQAIKTGFEAAFDGFLGGSRPCGIDVVPRAVDTKVFAPASPEWKAKARQLLKVPASVDNIVLYLGRLTPNHKADLVPLLSAFTSAAGPKDFLLVVGPENAPGYRDSLVKEAERLGLSGRAMFRSELDPDFRSIAYAASDIFVFPGDTVQEALGNTVCEAMAAGLPVLCSDWDGFKDLVVDGETGYLVPTYWIPGTRRSEEVSPLSELVSHYLMLAQSVWIDTEAMTARLHDLLASPGLRQRLGANGRARAERMLAPEVVMGQKFDLFEDLIEAARAESPEAKARRAGNSGLGMICPRSVFASYATGDLATVAAQVRISQKGKEVLQGKAGVALYDEVLAVTHPALYDAVLHGLAEADRPQMAQTLVEECSRKLGVDTDDIWFHLGVLAKRGYVNLKPMKHSR